MIHLSTAVSGGLTFSSNWRGFELKQNDQIVGALRCQTMWSSSFEASTPQENWIIRRGGFWGNKAQVLDAASQQPIAHFKSAWGGKGTLTFADGQTFLIGTRGIWYPVWTVTTEAPLPVLELHTREKSVVLGSVATVPENRIKLLVLFTLYRVRQAEEAAAAAVAAAS
jgi:hypothetical protein